MLVYEVTIKNINDPKRRTIKFTECESDFDCIGANRDAVDNSYIGYSSISLENALKQLHDLLRKNSNDLDEVVNHPVFNLIKEDEVVPVRTGEATEYTVEINLETKEITTLRANIYDVEHFDQFEGTCQYDEFPNKVVYALSYESEARAKQHLLNGLNQSLGLHQDAIATLEANIRESTSL